MKKLLTIITLAAATISAKAELTANDFAIVKNSAEASGYSYKGIDDIDGHKFLIFTHEAGNWAIVPVEAATAMEAAMAFFASSNAVHVVSAVAKKQLEDQARINWADKHDNCTKNVCSLKEKNCPVAMYTEMQIQGFDPIN